MTALLSLDRVSLALGGKPVLSEISFTLQRGEVLTILGPSGCGKTSLLRLISGLIRPDQGRVLLNGQNPEAGRGSAMVFQSYRLLPWRTVLENITFALPNLSRSAAETRAREMLRLVGLERVAEAWPKALSGGMQQRVALARALAVQPEILLMDEPFAALDAQARELMQAELLRLVQATGGPGVIFVTHSVDEALCLGDRVLVLSARPGRIHVEFTPVFAPDRRERDPRDHAAFPQLRREIWQIMRNNLLDDPASDFYRQGGLRQGK